MEMVKFYEENKKILIAKLTVQHQNWQTNALNTDLTNVNSIIQRDFPSRSGCHNAHNSADCVNSAVTAA